VVEGGQIDRASHDNNAEKVIADSIDFDAAVAVARQFASAENSLIIVTADHETGGMIVSHQSSGFSNGGR